MNILIKFCEAYKHAELFLAVVILLYDWATYTADCCAKKSTTSQSHDEDVGSQIHWHWVEVLWLMRGIH